MLLVFRLLPTISFISRSEYLLPCLPSQLQHPETFMGAGHLTRNHLTPRHTSRPLSGLIATDHSSTIDYLLSSSIPARYGTPHIRQICSHYSQFILTIDRHSGPPSTPTIHPSNQPHHPKPRCQPRASTAPQSQNTPSSA